MYAPSPYQIEAKSFLKELVYIWKVDTLEIIDIEYLGEKMFGDFEVVENRLTFKRNNSITKTIDLLVSLDLSRTLFGKYEDICTDILFKNIVYLYNHKNSKSYIKNSIGSTKSVKSDLYKNEIYKMKVKIKNIEEHIYFNMDAKKFFDI